MYIYSHVFIFILIVLSFPEARSFNMTSTLLSPPHYNYHHNITVYRKKYQWEKVPSGVWYFFLRKKYHIGTFSYWYIFLYNRKKYHNISIVIGKSTIWC